MNTPFPFGFPAPTAFYLTLYVLTLCLHVICMNYVLAGSAYLLVSSFRARNPDGITQPLREELLKWMPLALSLAITAGIAPLLFIQILYQKEFYVANLLRSHRWMSILPVLIVAFYLLYAMGSHRIRTGRHWVRIVLAGIVFCCFGWIAIAWTENHLLSVAGQEVWLRQYASGSLQYRTPEMLPRLALWFTGAFPTMCLILGWQLRAAAAQARRGGSEAVDSSDAVWRKLPVPGSRRVTMLALGGLTGGAVSAVVYYISLPEASRDVISSSFVMPWLVTAVVGFGIQFAAWAFHLQSRRVTRKRLGVATVGLVLTVVGVSVSRECLRISRVDFEQLYDRHAAASRVGGFALFLFFLVVNTGIIVWCIRLVRRGIANEKEASTSC